MFHSTSCTGWVTSLRYVIPCEANVMSGTVQANSELTAHPGVPFRTFAPSVLLVTYATTAPAPGLRTPEQVCRWRQRHACRGADTGLARPRNARRENPLSISPTAFIVDI